MRNLPLITIGVLALLGLACAAGREGGSSLLPPIPEVWYRCCRESARSGMLTARAVAAVYTGKVKEEE